MPQNNMTPEERLKVHEQERQKVYEEERNRIHEQDKVRYEFKKDYNIEFKITDSSIKWVIFALILLLAAGGVIAWLALK